MKKHKVIQGLPQDECYAYNTYSSSGNDETTGASRAVNAAAAAPPPITDGEAPPLDVRAPCTSSKRADDDVMQQQLIETILRARQYPNVIADASVCDEMWKKAIAINEGITAEIERDHRLCGHEYHLHSEMQQAAADQARDQMVDYFEKQYLELQERLSQRSAGLQHGDTKDFDEDQRYRRVVEEVLAVKNEKERLMREKEEAARYRTLKQQEHDEIIVFCRDTILLQMVFYEGFLAHETAIAVSHEAELQRMIIDDAERRECARLEREEAYQQEVQSRERRYLECADPVLRTLRQEAADRREQERQKEEEAEEAELRALEARCAEISAGSKLRTTTSSSGTTRLSGSRGTPYWKKS